MKNEYNNLKREKILKEIVKNEWYFFTNVNNIKKRSYCQDDSQTFIFSRLCYWGIYNDIILNSYLNDLIDAKNNNRNLVTEKYAYMMQYTDPSYYKSIEHKLPKISAFKSNIINSIMLIYMSWEEDIKNKNSKLLDNNRDLYNQSISTGQTTIEQYFKGELTSYSESTLNLILKYYLSAYNKGINLVERNLNNLHQL
ncbi:DUF4125 family protein [Peptoniphilus sp. MSJ-1]|uniref:DUF4125 family protein n=1 Tax=Peptoniphilus ovalis TaxID=2841503 RepID=A0ABS6FKR1_9FIRM|nr:DUF4125 family protein [Peptoniphilus ovalis]MBU5669780.1 DUF4125 family protein [Peptoniphilus ovalis]